MKQCPKGCLVLVDSSDFFCPNCGKKLVGVEKCSCGRLIGLYDKFCPKCGKKR